MQAILLLEASELGFSYEQLAGAEGKSNTAFLCGSIVHDDCTSLWYFNFLLIYSTLLHMN